MYNESKNSIENLWNELGNKTDVNKIQELENEFSSRIVALSSSYENQMSNLKSDFESRFNEQKMHYEAKLSKMENLIKQMELENKENKEKNKGFFQKVIEKYIKR